MKQEKRKSGILHLFNGRYRFYYGLLTLQDACHLYIFTLSTQKAPCSRKNRGPACTGSGEMEQPPYSVDLALLSAFSPPVLFPIVPVVYCFWDISVLHLGQCRRLWYCTPDWLHIFCTLFKTRRHFVQQNKKARQSSTNQRAIKKSEWRDSNSRPPAPKAGALPTAQHPGDTHTVYLFSGRSSIDALYGRGTKNPAREARTGETVQCFRAQSANSGVER